MQATTQVSSSTNSPAPAGAKRRGWLGRNWLRLFVVLVVLAAAAAAGGYYKKFGPILFSKPYQQALVELRQSPQVKKLLGEPIHDGWFPAGSVNNDEGEARFYLKIHGPKGADGQEPMADVSVQARSVGGEWDFTQFDVQSSAGPKLNLMDEISSRKPPEVPLFNGNGASTPLPKTDAARPPDVKIDIPDLPSDDAKK